MQDGQQKNIKSQNNVNRLIGQGIIQTKDKNGFNNIKKLKNIKNIKSSMKKSENDLIIIKKNNLSASFVNVVHVILEETIFQYTERQKNILS